MQPQPQPSEWEVILNDLEEVTQCKLCEHDCICAVHVRAESGDGSYPSTDDGSDACNPRDVPGDEGNDD